MWVFSYMNNTAKIIHQTYLIISDYLFSVKYMLQLTHYDSKQGKVIFAPVICIATSSLPHNMYFLRLSSYITHFHVCKANLTWTLQGNILSRQQHYDIYEIFKIDYAVNVNIQKLVSLTLVTCR